MKVVFVMSKYRNSTSCENSFSNAKQHSSFSFFCSNFVFDLDSPRSTADFWEKFAMNSELDCIIHRKLINSSLLVGDEMRSNASTLDESGLTPSLSISIPQNLICFSPKLHLSGFSVRPIAYITCRTTSLRSSCVLVAMIRSLCIKCAWGIWAKIDLSATLISLCAGLNPMVRRL